MEDTKKEAITALKSFDFRHVLASWCVPDFLRRRQGKTKEKNWGFVLSAPLGAEKQGLTEYLPCNNECPVIWEHARFLPPETWERVEKSVFSLKVSCHLRTRPPLSGREQEKCYDGFEQCCHPGQS